MGVLTVLMSVLVMMLIFSISSFPLYKIVKALKGSTTFSEILVINLIGGIILSLVNNLFFIWGGLIVFALLFFVYRPIFQFSWLKTLLAWFLEFIMIAILIFITLLIEFSLGLSMVI